MKRISVWSVLVVVAIACGVFGSVALAGVNMQEGSWETTLQMKMEGLPFPMPPMTFKTTQCLTKKDLVPNTASKDQKCEVADQKVSGNTVTWKVTCREKDGSASLGDGEVSYSGASYAGVIRMKFLDKSGQPAGTSTTTTLAGRRVGDCAK